MEQLVSKKASDVIAVTPRIFPQFKGKLLQCNGFTPDKAYAAVRVEGFGVVVLNDYGHPRFVCLDGSGSAHLTKASAGPAFYGYNSQEIAGYFEVEWREQL
jgi:hypothetical protein